MVAWCVGAAIAMSAQGPLIFVAADWLGKVHA